MYLIVFIHIYIYYISRACESFQFASEHLLRKMIRILQQKVTRNSSDRSPFTLEHLRITCHTLFVPQCVEFSHKKEVQDLKIADEQQRSQQHNT